VPDTPALPHHHQNAGPPALLALLPAFDPGLAISAPLPASPAHLKLPQAASPKGGQAATHGARTHNPTPQEAPPPCPSPGLTPPPCAALSSPTPSSCNLEAAPSARTGSDAGLECSDAGCKAEGALCLAGPSLGSGRPPQQPQRLVAEWQGQIMKAGKAPPPLPAQQLQGPQAPQPQLHQMGGAQTLQAEQAQQLHALQQGKQRGASECAQAGQAIEECEAMVRPLVVPQRVWCLSVAQLEEVLQVCACSLSGWGGETHVLVCTHISLCGFCRVRWHAKVALRLGQLFRSCPFSSGLTPSVQVLPLQFRSCPSSSGLAPSIVPSRSCPLQLSPAGLVPSSQSSVPCPSLGAAPSCLTTIFVWRHDADFKCPNAMPKPLD